MMTSLPRVRVPGVPRPRNVGAPVILEYKGGRSQLVTHCFIPHARDVMMMKPQRTTEAGPWAPLRTDWWFCQGWLPCHGHIARWPQASRCRYARRQAAARADGSPPSAPRQRNPSRRVRSLAKRAGWTRAWDGGAPQAMLCCGGHSAGNASLPPFALVTQQTRRSKGLTSGRGNGVLLLPSPNRWPMRPLPDEPAALRVGLPARTDLTLAIVQLER